MHPNQCDYMLIFRYCTTDHCCFICGTLDTAVALEDPGQGQGVFVAVAMAVCKCLAAFLVFNAALHCQPSGAFRRYVPKLPWKTLPMSFAARARTQRHFSVINLSSLVTADRRGLTTYSICCKVTTSICIRCSEFGPAFWGCSGRHSTSADRCQEVQS
jgi:hypothetical protein